MKNCQQYLILTIFLLFVFQINISQQSDCHLNQHLQDLKNKGIQRQFPNPSEQDNHRRLEQRKMHDSKRKLESWSELGLESYPKNLRLSFDYSNLDSGGTYYNSIVNSLNIAKQYFSDLIKVFPLTDNIIIKQQLEINNGLEGLCFEQQYFSILSSHTTIGVSDTDLLIYVQTVDESTEDYLAFASSCQWLHDRPTVGYIVINLAYMDQVLTDTGFDEHLETIIHELFHSMGFAGDMVAYFRSKEGRRIPDDDNDYIVTETIRGIETQMLTSPEVKKYNKLQFGCSTSIGAQLENQGSSGSLGSHWERTVFYNEMMNPSSIQSDAVTSYLTMAFLKDSNWYADINYDLAEPMQWGENQGCNFLDTCSESYDEFKIQDDGCSYYRYSYAFGAVESFSDECGVMYGKANYDCTNESNNSADKTNTYEVNSETSKCFNSDFIASGQSRDLDQRCYQYTCNTSDDSVDISITVGSNQYTVTCNSNGQIVSAPSGSGLSGTLTCPENLSKFCQFPSPCTDYCSHHGYCLQTGYSNTCVCIDGYAGETCSQSCTNYYDTTTSTCVTSCPSNTYLNDRQNTCHECPSTCSSGYCDSTGQCLQCEYGQYLNSSGSCVSECPEGTYASESTRECQVCSSDCADGCIRTASNCLVIPVNYADTDDLIDSLSSYPCGLEAGCPKKPDGENSKNFSNLLSFIGNIQYIAILMLTLIINMN